MGVRSIVLASGGIDSGVCLVLAKRESAEVLALIYDYGQKAQAEIDRARHLTAFLDIPHMVISLPDFGQWGGSSLTDEESVVPAELKIGISSTYVPHRNLVFLAVACSYAEARQFDRVYIGVHSDDFTNYPDCRKPFIEAAQMAVLLGGTRGVRLMTPLQGLTKADIFMLARQLGIPKELTWSCYLGGAEPCGTCPSCLARQGGERQAAGHEINLLSILLRK